MIPGQVVYNWVNGSRLIARPGEQSVTANIYCGLAEFADMAYLLHVLSPKDLFVDVGANIGSYTVLACAAKKAKGYCFEPVPSTFERLMDNIRLNDLRDRVTALNIGVADAEGELTFTAGEDSTNHVLSNDETSSDSVRVKVLSLDTALHGEPASVLKIDVEGYETRVLAGARATLSNPCLHSVIIELNGNGARYGFDEDKILKTMADFGFSMCAYEPFSRQLRNLSGKNCASMNTLFVRDARGVRDRIRESPPALIGSVQV